MRSSAARAVFTATGAAAVLLLASLWRPHVGSVMPLVVAATLLLSLARPAAGVLVALGLGPVTPMLSVVVHADQTGLHFTEALVLAFLAGVSFRRAVTHAPLAVPPRILWPATLLIVAALASAAIQEPVLAVQQQPPLTALAYAKELVGNYLALHNNVILAVQFAEGLLLLLVVADVLGRDREARGPALRMLVAGGAAAAGLNVVRLLIAAMRQPDALHALRDYALNSRINAQYSDWNAAGSYFAMVLVIAVAFVLGRRFRYAAPALLVLAALWLTGSRTAIAAVLLVGAAAAVLPVRRLSVRYKAALAGALILIVIIAAIGWRYYPAGRNDPAAFSWNTRLVLWKAGVRMMATDPLFGVGVGRFYDLSQDYAGPVLALIWRPHENAHNNFVQVLAELGIPGLLFFVAAVAGSLLPAARAARQNGEWGVPVALATYLVTCLTGHPLLVPEAAFPFWAVLGLAAASEPPSAPPQRRWKGALAGVLIALYVVSVPPRMVSAMKNADRENETIGLSPWQQADGRFRWAANRASFYYPSSGRAIRIPLRHGPDAPPDIVVRVYFDGQEADRVQLRRDEDWRLVRIVRTHQGSDAAFFRIDLEVVDANTLQALPPGGRMLMVGQPSIVWQQ